MALLRVLDRPCDQCPFTGKLKLAPGRLADIVKGCHRQGHEKHFICHQTIAGAGAVGVQPVMCRGFHDRYPDCSQLQQVAARLGLLEEVTLTQALDRSFNPKIRRQRMPRERMNLKRRPRKDEGPACIGCGCTQEFACEGGCTWINGDPPICSSCGPAWMIAELWRVLRLTHSIPGNLALERSTRAAVGRLRRVYGELSRVGAVPSLKSLIRFKTAELSSPGKNEGKKRQRC